MQTYCKYTGLMLTKEHYTANLGLSPSEHIVAEAHPLFGKPLELAYKAATFKPVQEMSTAQRHLLAVVLMQKSGLLKIRHPITMESFGTTQPLLVLPVLIAATSRILLNSKEWSELLPMLPSMNYRQDNAVNFGWQHFAKQVLFKSTEFLTFANPKQKVQARLISEDLEESELDKEHIIAHLIQGTGSKRFKTPEFTINHLKIVFGLMNDALVENSKPKLTLAMQEKIIKLMITPHDRLTIKVSELMNIRKAFIHYLDKDGGQGISATAIAYREAYALTMAKLNAMINALTDKASIFGEITSPAAKKELLAGTITPKAQFTIIQPTPVQAQPAPQLTEAAIAEVARRNPALAAIMRMKAAKQAEQGKGA